MSQMKMTNNNQEAQNIEQNEIGLKKRVYLSDFWRGLAKFWWLCVLLTVLFSCGAYFYFSATYVPLYSASSTFAVTVANYTSSDSGISTYSYNYSKSTSGQMAELFTGILNNSVLQERVCFDLGTTSVPARLSIATTEGTNLFTLYAVGATPQLTYDALQATLKNFPVVVEYAFGKTSLNILQEATVPTTPYNSGGFVTKSVKFGMIGLMIGLGVILLYALFRNTIRTRQDVEKELNSSCLGTLRHVVFKKYRRSVDQSITINNDLVSSQFKEEIRTLRNAVVRNVSGNRKTILVTGTIRGEGATTLSVNLALSLRALDKKILLVDGNIGNPGIAHLLGADPEKAQSTSFDYTKITRLEEKGVDLITFDVPKSKIWHVIHIGFLKKLFEAYRTQYDYIVIDAAPAGVAADPQIIAEAADTAIYVIRQDKVQAGRIRDALSALQATDVKMLGCVINGYTSGFSGYGYGGGYGYGYGYGYRRYGYGYRSSKYSHYGYNRRKKTK